MKGRFPYMLSWTGLIALILLHCSGVPSREGILAYLPEKNELGDWKPMGDPQTAEGEDLFLLINGGAEIYYEYGFRRAVIQSYTLGKDKSVNIEMYEMEDPAAAYGVYTFKTSDRGRPVSIGQEALQEDYYLNFWKGRFLVTLIGFDTDEDTKAGLMMMARAIESKIADVGQRPVLASYMNDARHVTYLEGNLGLYNKYEFDTQNIFALRMGVIGNYDDHRIFIFQYEDEGTCQEWFHRAGNALKKNPRFQDYHKVRDGFVITDAQNQRIYVTTYRNAILIYLGKQGTDAATVLKNMKQRLDSAFSDSDK